MTAIYLYALMGMLDLIITIFALMLGFMEANPIMNNVAHNYFLLSVLKIIGTLIVVFLAKVLYEKYSRKITRIYTGLALFIQSFVVMINSFAVMRVLWLIK